ncbi:MAG TPA: hypothetical protein PLO28_11995 [bacterium]|jgi:hypothetical protein|nr:hypothetical protein [bacterium]
MKPPVKRMMHAEGGSIPSLHELLALMNERTSRQAIELAGGKRVGWAGLLFPPLGRFLRIWLLKGLIWRGFSGFRQAWAAALQLMLLRMKIWHLQNHLPAPGGPQGRVRP